jgi:hypothetical protein
MNNNLLPITGETDYPIYKNSLVEYNTPHTETNNSIKVVGKDNVEYLGEGTPILTSEMDKILSANNKKWEYADSTAYFGPDKNMTKQEWIIPGTNKKPNTYKIITDYTHPELETALYQQSPTGVWKKIATDLEE